MSDSVRPQRRQPTRLLHPWDSPGKNTGVGCHFLLQCVKVKSECEVTQSCPTLCDPMDCSLPGSSIRGISRQEYWSGVPLPSPRSMARKLQFFNISLKQIIGEKNMSPDSFLVFAAPCSLWDLSSPTRDCTQALASESTEF